jgi:PPM family protein phosphatase
MQLSPCRLHQWISVSAYGMTDVGRVRRANEDNFLIDESLGFFALTDGMGGHAAGEIASAQALQTTRDFIQKTLHHRNHPTPDADDTVPHFPVVATQIDPDATWADSSMPAVQAVYSAIEFANHEIYLRNTASLHGDGRGMGTTLVGCWQFVAGAPIVVFNVGDSRAYMQRNGQLTQLTKDQTLYQQAVDMGYTENMPPRNLLLQAIGPNDSITPEVFTHTTRSGDILMLCSDGLHGPVSDAEMSAVLAHACAQNLEQCCEELIRLANNNGGRDNITVLLAYCW